ncbi:hypothetical protein [Brazilian marseillevirus]|uniref:hypothetical protein n=1 Tax=Brazilian marseillevirus TaxID=1813599 RepID=UPI0007832CB0|nr:hypothetical protein A3303_gp274 [Brazilian marseillevirus]AMQ10782.1 hypothetical protein [Brazilian marseillevirus]
MAEEAKVTPKKYSVIVNCLPRTTPLVSKKPEFGELGNLYLDMIEVKEKLRPGLPLVPIQKPVQPPKEKKEEKKVEEPTPIIVSPSPSQPEKKEPEEKKTEEVQPGLVFLDELDEEEEADDEELEELLEDKKPTPVPSVAAPSIAAAAAAIPVVSQEEPQEDDEDSESESEDEPEQPIDEDDNLTEEQKEEKEKDELLWKFKILKKKHPQHLDTIPDFDEHSDIVTMRRKYQMTVKELHMESKLFEYRKFVFFGGCIFEGLFTNILGIDFKGFSEVQDIHGYDALLVELGEKSYTNFTSYLPVEVRLVIAFAVNVAIFYIFKTMSVRVTSEELFTMISQVGGEKIADFFRNATGKDTKKKEQTSAAPKKRMRGPTIRAEDVQKMSIGKED